MAGYAYRAGRPKCPHGGEIYEPPRNEVARVACPYCKAPAGKPCVEGQLHKVVEPHSVRYLAHHDANCAAA